MTKDFEHIRYDVADGVVTLALNHPEKLNAFSNEMGSELMAAIDRTDADDDVRVVIVTGAGRGFCAGADVSSGANTFDYDNNPARNAKAVVVGGVHRDFGGLVSLRFFESLKPMIAAINGPAVGVGITMTLPMDVRMASTQSKFGFVFARRGIVPEAASSWFLPRVVGISTALEWVATGRVFSAEEAKERGLVRSLHAPDDLLPAARALAREIADNTAPVSVAASRRVLWELLGADHPMRAHKIESRLIMERGRSADAAEGISAFLEKRPAKFPMRVSKDLPALPRNTHKFED